MFVLYCLKCCPGRWYVGYTPQWRWPERREEHFSGAGSQWCRRHGVEAVVWTKLVVAEKEARRLEDVECAEILAQHGWNACRGGLFNLRADVTSCPPWIVRAYLNRKSEIDRATAKAALRAGRVMAAVAKQTCFERAQLETAVLSS